MPLHSSHDFCEGIYYLSLNIDVPPRLHSEREQTSLSEEHRESDEGILE